MGALLGQTALTVLKGGGGEFERLPSKAVELFGRRGSTDWSGLAPALVSDTRRLAEDDRAPGDLALRWEGTLQDPFAETIVTGTAALALETAGVAAEARGKAMGEALLSSRHRARAA